MGGTQSHIYEYCCDERCKNYDKYVTFICTECREKKRKGYVNMNCEYYSDQVTIVCTDCSKKEQTVAK